MARVDMEVARALCRRHGMTHVRVPIECVSDETRQRYLERVGYAGNSGKARDFLQAAERHLDVSKVWLIGYAGEVGRAFYWKPADRADIPSDPDDLLSRMNLPTNERFRRAMEGWIHGLSGMDLQTVLDFMYLEQRMGAWASAHMHGSAPGMNVMTPFCHRQVMQSMLRLPTAYTYRQRLASDVIAVAWPDLGRLPFQRRPGAIGYLRHFGRRHVAGTFRRSVDRLGDLRGKSVVYDQWYRSVRAVYRRVGKRGR